MSKINLILSREFTERVRKKSFIITTLLTPILMITLMAAPTLIMMLGKTSTKKVVVVDNSPDRFVGRQLKSGSTVEFRLLDAGITAAEARAQYSNADRAYGILIIGSDILSNPGNLQLILNDASSMSVEESINGQIQDIFRTERLSRYEIENIDRILADAGIRVNVQTLKNNVLATDEDSMEATSTTMSWLLGLTLGMLLYFILIVYGQQVLQSVIDEKQTRVLDVIITSCTPFELMMGKILGIALVAALQIVIWAVLVIGVSSFVMPLLIDPASVQAISDPMMGSAISSFTDVGFLLSLFVQLLVFAVGGFLFYASMYAAIGSAVDTPQDAAQFNSIIMMPVILAIIVMMNIMNDPNSGLVFWCSMIPFTSPIVMMARIPFGIPTWQVIVSIIVLFISFFIMTWIAARIFRVGVFMHGKKPTWKDLAAWIKMK
ncbi:MAG: ABC transporter permease [Bacteroidales bacterium]|jgi:ABC-2 type transport system permease protein|nr:ABC transporter permease [Bacteroidales bacterium]